MVSVTVFSKHARQLKDIERNLTILDEILNVTKISKSNADASLKLTLDTLRSHVIAVMPNLTVHCDLFEMEIDRIDWKNHIVSAKMVNFFLLNTWRGSHTNIGSRFKYLIAYPSERMLS